MAKISLLEELAAQDIDGTETLPVVKNGVARRAVISDIGAPAAARAEAAAADLAAARSLLMSREGSIQIIGNAEDIGDFEPTGGITSLDSSHIHSAPTAFDASEGALVAEIHGAAKGFAHILAYTGAGSLKTLVGLASKWCNAGYNRFVLEPSDFYSIQGDGNTLPAGAYLGFVGVGVIGFRSETGAGRWNGPGFASGAVDSDGYDFEAAGVLNNGVFGVKFTLLKNKAAANINPRDAVGNVLPVGTVETVGSPNVNAAPSGTASANWRALPKIYPNGGYVRAINGRAQTAGPIDIVTYEVDPTTLTIYDSVTVDMAAGLNMGVPVGAIVPRNGAVAVAPQARLATTGGGQWPIGVWANSDQNGKTIPRSGFGNTGGNSLLIQWEVVEWSAGQADVFARFDRAMKRVSAKDALPQVPNEALVFSLLGQSNMTDAGSIGGALPLDPGIVFAWDNASGAFVDLATSTDLSLTRTLMPALGKRLFEKTGMAIYLVNSAVGGTAISSAANIGNGHWGASGTLRGAHEARFAAATAWLESNVTAWQFGGAVTWQGGREVAAIDGGTPGVDETTWPTGFASYDDWLRTVHGPKFPHGLVALIFEDTTSAGFQAVHGAQMAMARDRDHVFMLYTGTINFHARGLMNADAIHANQQGKNEVGYRVADKMALLSVGIA